MKQDAVAARIGVDWADGHHDISLQESGSSKVERRRMEHTSEALKAWMCELGRRFKGRQVKIAVETSRGGLIYALLEYDFVVLYPVNPRSAQRFREAFAPSRAKDDPSDADLLLELLAKHENRLRAWQPDDANTRAVRRLSEGRRKVVDLQTKLTQQLVAALKEYYPQALDWTGARLASSMACDFLLRWPTLEALQRSRTSTIRKFYYEHNCRSGELIDRRIEEIRCATPLTNDPAVIESTALLVQALVRQLKTLQSSIAAFEEEVHDRFARHEDAVLFETLPGSGPSLAPRLLAALGSDRRRFPTAAHVQQFAGIAPVTERSGRREWVHWRWSAPTFVRQTFHEFAHHSIRFSPWAKAYYQLQRERGKGHPAAVRALAFKWIRIIWRCWQDRTPYDEERHLEAIRRRGSPLAARVDSRLAKAA